jgi:membrane protease subunit (stomatin/prohibitin family)
MALIDVISWDGGIGQVAWKFPSTNLRLGSQLIVNPGQSAFFVYRGNVSDEINQGTITLETGNIPFLTSLMSAPFGGDSPFQAEVWFINKLAKLDSKWGTTSPIQVEDPRYGVLVPVRAFGQYGFRVADSKIFLMNLLGSSQSLSDEQIAQYFRGKIISTISTQIGGLFNEKISFLNIASYLEDLSISAHKKIGSFMEPYGIKLETFFFESINVPNDDPSYLRLKEIKEKSAELNVVGRDIYQLDKSMDVLKTAAGNEGLAGLIMQSGVGAGMGLMMGAQMGQQAGNLMTQVTAVPPVAMTPPPMPTSLDLQFHAIINGQQMGPFSVTILKQMIPAGTFSSTTMVWRQGLAGWQPSSTLPELLQLFASDTPPPYIPPT